jgi:hypothetical protein
MVRLIHQKKRAAFTTRFFNLKSSAFEAGGHHAP